MQNPGDLAQGASLIPAGTLTSTTTGSAVDLQGYDGEAVVVLNAAASGVGTAAVKLTHSDTSGGTYTDISGAAFTTVSSSASHQLLSIDTDEIKRYIKAVVTIAGADASQTLSVSLVGWPQSL